MKKVSALFLCSAFLIFALTSHACAQEPNPWGAGIHYGAINNFKMFADADTDSGSLIAVSYSYDINDRYTAVLELGYIADNYVLPDASSPKNVETGTFINIDHMFYLSRSDGFSPYWKLGTGIYAVTLWKKQDKDFTFSASNVFADFSAGVGADLKLWGVPFNADLTLPALAHEAFFSSKTAYIFTLGYNYHF